MRKTFVIITFLFFSVTGWAQKTRNMSHEGSSGDVFIGYSLLNGDTFSHASGWEAALTGNFNDWFGLKADLGGNYKSIGGVGAREYNILFGPQLSLDYHGAHVFSTTQKDARYSVGLVYRFK
jgi:hypothetical protein